MKSTSRSTWKEKGIVPDSDDEDDALDSQNTSNEEANGNLDAPPAASQPFEPDGVGEIIIVHDELSLEEEDEDALSTPAATHAPLPRLRLSKSPRKDTASNLPPKFSATQYSEFPPSLEPAMVGSQASLHAGNTAEEEISRSYVRLSSPTSSLSSIASSQFSNSHYSPARISTLPSSSDQRLVVSDIVSVPPPHDASHHEDVSILEDANNYEATRRRSLRPRTQIQLHPYLLDSERHRREFKARGLRPLRLTQAQEEARKVAQNCDSQDVEFEAEEESQSTAIENGSQTSSAVEDLQSSPASSHADRRPQENLSHFESVTADVEEEEFPDINDLVKKFNKAKEPCKKSRMCAYGKTYSKAEYAPLLDSTFLDSPPTVLNNFDVPQSPPMTSSPRHVGSAWTGRSHRSLSPSGSDLGSEVPRDFRNRQGPVQIVDLLTPAMSSAKRAVEYASETLSDNGDPFASSPMAEETESSPAKEPVKIRKLLRGVLPASHIRINQQTMTPQPNLPRVTVRDSCSVSPVRPQTKRGVAIPRTASGPTTSTPADPRTELYFLSDESDEEDVFAIQGVVKETVAESQGLLSQSDFDYAIEDNRIDQMLPSQKRQRTLLSGAGRPKKKRVVTSLFRTFHDGSSYQPRITDLLAEPPPNPLSTQGYEILQGKAPLLAREVSKKIGSPRQKPIQSGIQDVMPRFNDPVECLPKFMRIAARSAGSRHALGRHGPTWKFVRLDNREDTVDAQTVLLEWKGISAKPRTHLQPSRPPLRTISENVENHMSLSLPNTLKSPLQNHSAQNGGKAAHKGLATNHQMKIPWSVTNSHLGVSPKVQYRKPRPLRSKRAPTRRAPLVSSALQARSAQLEISEAEYRNRDHEAAFGSTKRNLDKSYRRYHNGSAAESNVPLARFLADDDLSGTAASVPRSSVGPRQEFATSNLICIYPLAMHRHLEMANQVNRGIAQTSRQRKRHPRQLDATAAKYRQPDKPLIVASIETLTTSGTVALVENKLHGLGGSNSQYPIDFDVFPLRSGVYFHESTFIGQGKLAKALRTEASRYYDRSRGFAFYKIGARHMRWGIWDDLVSSEIGVCFDWIVNRLHDFVSTSLDVVRKDIDNEVVECMIFLIEYFQDTLTFESREESQSCLLRMIDVMQGLTECLEVLAGNLDSRDNLNNRRIMELSTFEVVLIFQTLRISATHRTSSISQHTTNQLETLLQRAAITSVKLLFIVGLSSVQSLYDDLQYLRVREAGIRPDQSPAQAWVILMHMMQAARIPRVSFWDAVNLQLLSNMNVESDARVMEKAWYSTFSLLPLMEIDELGVLIPRSRYRSTSENWTMPQKIAKRLFELYSLDAKQSPSFNNYCKAMFSRCHHLIQVWGWRRYGSIVGTFFDFFASHAFSHIGGETSYTVPEFLKDLDAALSSVIESEDECFHIFLKIVHSAIKQLREAGDEKEVRNLITRLLPNHDLEYQKISAKATDIASLRNHHDLLFTLYWAAPSELRHKICVMLDLVDQERLKKEAHLRNDRNQRR